MMNLDRGQALSGRTIVVTRPRDQSQELCARLESLGAEVVSFPTIKIVAPPDPSALHKALAAIDGYEWILFTSRNAVDAVAGQFDDDLRAGLSRLRLAAVGEATRRCLEQRGVTVDFVPSKFNMATLCHELISAHSLAGVRILYPCGDLVESSSVKPLSDAGAKVDMVVAYRTIPDDSADVGELRTRLADGKIDAILFASPSAVRNFFLRIEQDKLPGSTCLISIGSRTSEAIAPFHTGRCVEAKQSGDEHIIDAVVKHLTARAPGRSWRQG